MRVRTCVSDDGVYGLVNEGVVKLRVTKQTLPVFSVAKMDCDMLAR